jgi:signal transduction histidine kinase
VIGNVAHDLRTPLQAFQSEIELLRECIKNDDTPEKQKFQRKSITQLGRICHFMNMTINRSIDFTKASSGIKLNPSIESISFSDTMTWAVGCMVTTQGKVPIVLEPIPAAIHGYIYTDKQWLMENMLCLLSNAQKFTTDGEINIRCSLHSMFQGSVVQSLKSSSPASKRHFSDPVGGRECNGRSRRDLSSWREKVAGFVDIEIGASPTVTESAAPMLLIEIEDSGIGITKENREKLFQPFMQVYTLRLTVHIVIHVRKSQTQP